MNSLSEKFTLSTFSASVETESTVAKLDSILANLSCLISNEHLDIKNAGISIYDPFSIQEGTDKTKREFRVPGCRAISLRSKSTRNLHVKRHRRRNLS